MTEPQNDPSDPGTTPEAQIEPEPEPKPGSEAARYRVRAREAEAARDVLAARVERFQRAQVDAIAGQRLAAAEDLFVVGGLDMTDLTGEDGEVDRDLVLIMVETLIRTRPGLAKVPPHEYPDLGGGRRGGTPTAPGPTWAKLFHPERG